jgi:class 3 adenylate cyclase
MHDLDLLRWAARYMRLSAAPFTSTRMYAWVLQLDVRSILPSIQAPTLVLHRSGNRHYRAPMGRYLAEHIPRATYVELPGADWYPAFLDSEPLLDEVEAFLTGVRPPPAEDRILATVLFTDIVGSTQHAARLGDQGWVDLRARHDALVRSELDRFRGREVVTTGDGFLAIFDGPARAVRCAMEVSRRVRSLGIEIRAGLHTGEIEVRGREVAGLAVNIAARVMALADDARILVSGTVKDLVVGSGIEFGDWGAHRLKGVPGEWQVHEVVAAPG